MRKRRYKNKVDNESKLSITKMDLLAFYLQVEERNKIEIFCPNLIYFQFNLVFLTEREGL